ncbi:ATP-binding protein [Angustibacter sp. McL0619]|uniref:AAA family ATPase n=1 Tax=Angustibacter sp. McL0619 TaxID=3415676 RepID=UPI003CEB3789
MTDPGLEYLLARLSLVRGRVRRLVAARREVDPAPDDPFRGLYISEDTVTALLDHHLLDHADDDPDTAARAAVEGSADELEAAGQQPRLRRLAEQADLDGVDVELLLIAMAPDVDSGFERLYGYLNDDVSRRRATVGLALDLLGVSAASATVRARMSSPAPLVEQGLLLVEDTLRPVLTRALRVPDRVTAFLLGSDTVDAALATVVTEPFAYDGAQSEQIDRALSAGVTLVYARESVAGTGSAIAVAAMHRGGRVPLCLDLEQVCAGADPLDLVAVAGREALLRGAGIVAGPVEGLAAANPEALRRLTEQRAPVVLVGTTTWDPRWSPVVPLALDVRAMTKPDRENLWREAMAAVESEVANDAIDAAQVTEHFVLGPQQVSRAVRSARTAALSSGERLSEAELRRGARVQNAAGLERLARRVEPEVTFADLVLPPSVLHQLHDLAGRARHRDLVLAQWKMRAGGGRGRGITALFAGDSGTGKTMSAEAIAGDLGLELYTVNLATVIDKYVGETEKNLERIFAEASGVNAVLLFDEADAIFGKRSEVRDAHDRYANIESAYLLQRMETFDGLAVLATNLRANIDDAFTRRLDTIIDFPPPDPELRRELWRRCLAPPLPCADDLDLDFCAASFALSGGNIRSIAITAAYLAAGADKPVGMAELVAAIQLEYRKLGRLVLASEFGRYHHVLH